MTPWDLFLFLGHEGHPGGSSHRISSNPKAPPPNTTAMWGRASTNELGGHKHSVQSHSGCCASWTARGGQGWEQERRPQNNPGRTGMAVAWTSTVAVEMARRLLTFTGSVGTTIRQFSPSLLCACLSAVLGKWSLNGLAYALTAQRCRGTQLKVPPGSLEVCVCTILQKKYNGIIQKRRIWKAQMPAAATFKRSEGIHDGWGPQNRIQSTGRKIRMRDASFVMARGREED